jgi:hypothetical protein
LCAGLDAHPQDRYETYIPGGMQKATRALSSLEDWNPSAVGRFLLVGVRGEPRKRVERDQREARRASYGTMGLHPRVDC